MDSTSNRWIETLLEAADSVRAGVSPLLAEPGARPVQRFKDLLDQHAHAAVRDTLRRSRVSARLVSEEGEATLGRGRYTVTADPVDGTTNLARGLGPSVVSLSVSETPRQHGVLAALVMELETGAVYTAGRGGPAALDGREIRVAEPVPYAEGLISLDVSKMADPSGMLPLIAGARHLRSSGCAALSLCRVAQGVLDAHVDERGSLRATDASAGVFILKQAGGCWCVNGSLGGDFSLDRRSRFRITAASSRALLEEIQSLARSAEFRGHH